MTNKQLKQLIMASLTLAFIILADRLLAAPTKEVDTVNPVEQAAAQAVSEIADQVSENTADSAAIKDNDPVSITTEVVMNEPTQTDLQRLASLVIANDYAAAYELAKSLEQEYSGTTEFDYLFGLAALYNGKPGEAIFPLERVLLAYPHNHRARLELALAQFVMGDYIAAQANFIQVKEANPPETVVNKINIMLERISQQTKKQGLQFSKSVGMSVGFDNNINSINAAQSVPTPTVALTLAEDDRKKSDYFTSLTAGVKANYPFDKMRSIFGGVNFKELLHSKHRKFDQAVGSFELGPQYANQHGRLRVPLTANYVLLDRQAYQRVWQIGADWTQKADDVTENVLFASIARNRYKSQPLQDTATVTFGTGFTRNLQPWPWLGVINIVAGKVNPHRIGGEHNAKNSLSSELKGIYLHNNDNMGFVGINIGRDHYESPHPVFGAYRRDAFARISLGWRSQIAKNLFLSPEGFYMKNRSNTQVYDYNRTQVSLNISYNF